MKRIFMVALCAVTLFGILSHSATVCHEDSAVQQSVPMDVEGEESPASVGALSTGTVAQRIANIDEMLAGQGPTAIAQLIRMAAAIRQQQDVAQAQQEDADQ